MKQMPRRKRDKQEEVAVLLQPLPALVALEIPPAIGLLRLVPFAETRSVQIPAGPTSRFCQTIAIRSRCCHS